MKKTKEFFVVLFSILICVFLVVFIVQATTTISTNIVTEGTVVIGTTNGTPVELKVVGTASVSEELWASGSVQFGAGSDTATAAYSRFGAGSTGHSLADADDVLITGLLEVDDLVYFDKDVTFAGSASTSGEIVASGSVQFGGVGIATASYSRFGSGTTDDGLADADDVLITGLLEVDATASFDSAVSVSGVGILLDDRVTITSGTASPSGNCVIGSLYLRTGTASSSMATMFNMCTADNTWTSLASASDPGLW